MRRKYYKTYPTVSFSARNHAAANIHPVPDTQDHGKRGLTLKRATGPTEVAIHRFTEFGAKGHQSSKPTVIPKAVVMKKEEEGRRRQEAMNMFEQRKVPDSYALWQKMFATGETEWRCVILRNDGLRKDYKYYHGNRLFFVREVSGYAWLTGMYSDNVIAMLSYKHENCTWEGPFPSTALPNSS